MTAFFKIFMLTKPSASYIIKDAMQQSTIFAILLILLNKRRVSRDYLAERFSISKRTVSRYIGVLQDAGVPISSSVGMNGGIWLSDDYRLDKTFFSEAELIRLKDALSRTESLYADSVNRLIAEKLDSAHKSRAQDNCSVRQEDLYIDSEYEHGAKLRPKLKIFSQAIESRRAVEIKYTDARGFDSFRTVEPYTLVFKAGYWYVYAMCKLRGDFRLFKLSRINGMRITSKSFVRAESKLIEKLELEYYNEVYIDVEIEFYPTVSEAIIDWLGKKAVTERGTKLVASAEVPFTDGLVKKLLSFGSSIKVLAPDELADKLKTEARLMLDAYER